MTSLASSEPSLRNWGSRFDHLHRTTTIDGCYRMEVFKRYVRRRWRGKEPKKNSLSAVAVEAAMGSLDPSRVCAECGTHQTPLWRSGPKGPKSLCNACGIRCRKRRKAEINGGYKHRKSSAAISTATSTVIGKNGSMVASLEAVGEELRRRQKEKQRMLLLLLELQKQRKTKLKAAARAATAGGAGKEEAEAALLLLSLSSSGIFVHS